jgi:hypothetical protein
MSWTVEIPIIVRTLINDNIEPYQYCNDRLLQIIAVAAKYVQLDVSLDNTYVVNMTNLEMSPDPVVLQDEIFVSLVSLKAACLIDQSSLRTRAVTDGIRAALGPAMISVNNSLSGFMAVLEKGPCASYQELSNEWNISRADMAKAILSPFVGNNFDPRSLWINYHNRNLH